MKLLCENTFHNTECTLIPRDGRLSKQQMERMWRKLCGRSYCQCGGMYRYYVEHNGAEERCSLFPTGDGGATVTISDYR